MGVRRKFSRGGAKIFFCHFDDWKNFQGVAKKFLKLVCALESRETFKIWQISTKNSFEIVKILKFTMILKIQGEASAPPCPPLWTPMLFLFDYF
jgi:hypothetical protein